MGIIHKALLGFLIPLVVGGLYFAFNMRENSDCAMHPHCDAVVILTGDTIRIVEGLELAKRINAKYVFISGVGGKVTKHDIIRIGKNVLDYETQSKIVLGKSATSTITNAYETKIFAALNNLNSLCIVTSHYHMPRVKILFNDVLSDKKICYYRVICNDWSLWRILDEYRKFVVTYILRLL